MTSVRHVEKGAISFTSPIELPQSSFVPSTSEGANSMFKIEALI